jgi:hypothetical protein
VLRHILGSRDGVALCGRWAERFGVAVPDKHGSLVANCPHCIESLKAYVGWRNLRRGIDTNDR